MLVKSIRIICQVQKVINMDSCLVFDLEARYGHFRKVVGNMSKTTYSVPPRTTIAGICAAITGEDRDSYYEKFSKNSSRVSCQILSPLRKIKYPVSVLDTETGMKKYNSRSSKSPTLIIPRDQSDRQRHTYKLLVNPRYRFYISLDDKDYYRKLKDFVSQEKSYYTPSMGLSEFIASISYVGEFNIEESNSTKVDSVVPGSSNNIIPKPEIKFGMERSQAFMEKRENEVGRRTTEFMDLVYPQGKDKIPKLEVQNSSEVKNINGENIIFY